MNKFREEAQRENAENEKTKFDYEIAFQHFEDKKIVLYGTGRMTATLVPRVKKHHIIGLCDKDDNMVG